MDPNISIYNSYRKALNTISGSFPVYANNSAGCVTKNVAQEIALSLAALDETTEQYFLVREFNPSSPLYDPFTDIGLLIDIDSLVLDPLSPEEIYTYNLTI